MRCCRSFSTSTTIRWSLRSITRISILTSSLTAQAFGDPSATGEAILKVVDASAPPSSYPRQCNAAVDQKSLRGAPPDLGNLRPPGSESFSRRHGANQVLTRASAPFMLRLSRGRLLDYFFTPKTPSFAALATRNLTTVLAGILICCCVFGLIRARFPLLLHELAKTG
jgi:hypothetical protein